MNETFETKEKTNPSTPRLLDCKTLLAQLVVDIHTRLC